ncbi:MAG: SPOR domain-containing protein, partial [Pseudomonadota bacterium]
VGANLLRFDSGANALTLRAEGDYDIDRSDLGFRLRIGFEANEGRLSPARRPDELDFLPLRRAQQRERVRTNRLTPQGPQQMDAPAIQNGDDIAVTHAVDRYIQVMALSTKAAALELQQTLDQKLDMPIRLVSGGGFYRVQVGTHAHGIVLLRQRLNALGYADTFMVKQD